MTAVWTTKKSWLAGATLLVLAHLLWWFVLVGMPFGELIRVMLYVVPVVAAFVVTYLAPTQKLLLGMSMGLAGAVLGFVAMVVYAGLGYHVDKIGGPLATFAILLVYHLGYALVGTSAGYLAWRYRSRLN